MSENNVEKCSKLFILLFFLIILIQERVTSRAIPIGQQYEEEISEVGSK